MSLVAALFAALSWCANKRIADATVASVEAAKTSAEAASGSAEAARQLVDSGQRAWVVHISSSLEKSFIQIGLGRMSIITELKNCGLTPAINVRIQQRFVLSEAFNDKLFAALDPNAIGPIGPDQPRQVLARDQIESADLKEMKENRKTLFVYGIILYHDVFNKAVKHETRWCLEFTVISSGELFVYTRLNNTLT